MTDPAVTNRTVNLSNSKQLRLLGITWDYPYDRLEIVFNVYSTTDLTKPMRWRATVTETFWNFEADKSQEFFTVTASNVVTGAESQIAGR